MSKAVGNTKPPVAPTPKKQPIEATPKTPALAAIAGGGSGVQNPNTVSPEHAAMLKRRKSSWERKQSLLGKDPPGALTKLHQIVIEIEPDNHETQEAAKAAAEKAKLEKVKAEKAQAAPDATKQEETLLAEKAKAGTEAKASGAEENDEEIPKHDGLMMLARSDALYVEPAGKEFEQIFGVEMNHKYVVMNSLGERVFFATETLEEYCEAFSPHREVDISVFAGFGGLVFEVQGDTRNAMVQIPHDHDTYECVGSVHKASPLSSTYKLIDQNKELAFRLERSREAEKSEVHEYEEGEDETEEEPLVGRDYNLFRGFGKKCIGEMNSHHEVFKKRDNSHTHHYGVTFPLSLDLHSKILICGALLLLNFLYFERFSVGNRRTQACAGIIFGCIVAFFILVLLAGIVTAILLSRGYVPPPPDTANKLPCDDFDT